MKYPTLALPEHQRSFKKSKQVLLLSVVIALLNKRSLKKSLKLTVQQMMM